MSNRRKSRRKHKRNHVLTIANEHQSLTEVTTPHGIATVWRGSQWTMFRFFYGGEYYVVRYGEKYPDSFVEPMALQWMDDIVNGRWRTA